jgi:hypothetical protein
MLTHGHTTKRLCTAVEVLGEVTVIKGLDKYPVALNAIAHKVLELRGSYQRAVEGARTTCFAVHERVGLRWCVCRL